MNICLLRPWDIPRNKSQEPPKAWCNVCSELPEGGVLSRNRWRLVWPPSPVHSLRPDPRWRQTFLDVQKILFHMSKWEDGRDKILTLTAAILESLEAGFSSEVPSSEAACIFDAIWLVLQMGYQWSKYCRMNPTLQSEKFCKVPMSAYTGTFTVYPIVFINAELSFL